MRGPVFLQLFFLQFISLYLYLMRLHVILLLAQLLLHPPQFQQLGTLVELPLYLKLIFCVSLSQGLAYHLLFVALGHLVQQSINFLIEVSDLFLPLQIEEVHLCLMSLLEFPQLSLVSRFDVFHFSVLQLFPQSFYLPFESLCLNVLSPCLTILLPSDGLLSAYVHRYINSYNLSQSIQFCSVFILVFSSFLGILGEGMSFLPVVGRLYWEVPLLIKINKMGRGRVLGLKLWRISGLRFWLSLPTSLLPSC